MSIKSVLCGCCTEERERLNESAESKQTEENNVVQPITEENRNENRPNHIVDQENKDNENETSGAQSNRK